MRKTVPNKLAYRRIKGNHVKIVQRGVETGNQLVNQIVNQEASPSDPQGSYTGRPLNQNEVPVQDADDL